MGRTVDALDLEFEHADVSWEGRCVWQGVVLAELTVGHVVSRSHPGRVTGLGSCREGVKREGCDDCEYEEEGENADSQQCDDSSWIAWSNATMLLR